jgi:hypothetical protein
MSVSSPYYFLKTAEKGGYNRSMKKFLALAFVLVLASAASAQTNWFKGTLDEAVAKAKVDHKLVLVDFYSYT